jgi:hypothetical protein
MRNLGIEPVMGSLDERERVDEDSGMAGVSGLSQRDQGRSQDSAERTEKSLPRKPPLIEEFFRFLRRARKTMEMSMSASLMRTKATSPPLRKPRTWKR